MTLIIFSVYMSKNRQISTCLFGFLKELSHKDNRGVRFLKKYHYVG